MQHKPTKELKELRNSFIDLRLALEELYPDLRKARMRNKGHAQYGEIVFCAPVRGITLK